MTTDLKLSPTIRINSIDLLRGIVMIIMALDHTRDFFHISAMTADPLNPETTTGAIFFTRWITHYCAPTFVFLSGVSAYLSAQKKTPAEARSFWVKRGIWLIIVEIFVVTLGLTFNPLYNFVVLQVIWVIGCSMILLALFSRLPLKFILITGLILIFGHDIFNHIAVPQSGPLGILIKVLFTAFGTVIPLGANHFLGIFYALLPWTGIMFVGYAVGCWYKKDYSPAKRRTNLTIAGIVAICLFIALRLINVYGDPAPRKEFGDILKNFLSFMNVSKYPPSLAYTCMTLGPALLVLAFSENIKGRISKVISVYGSVPFFYYIVHFYLLHFLLVILFFATGFGVNQIIPANMPFLFRPAEFGFALPWVYLIWISVVAVLYRPCVWFKNYKATHNQWWLSYL